MQINKIALVSAVLAGQLAFAASKDKEAPSWVSEVATRTTPVYSGKVPAAVLLDEQKVTVDSSGMVSTITRHAVKILTHDGKREAEVVEGYEKGGRQVKELRAWLVAPGGFVKTFDKGSVEDLGVYSDALYDDYRVRRIKAGNAEIGSVFVYESEVVEKATEAQDRFAFQVALPEVESRYSITVPAGWTARATILNHEPVPAVIEGNTYSWTLKNLPFREAEPGAPELVGTAPILAVDYQPPAGLNDPPAFKGWPDVSRWHTAIAEPQAEITPEMAAKVRKLTSGAATEADRIRTLCHYVQKVRYVEIAMDLSHNGGVRPHPAGQVFAKQYGDCKDKANLLLAMLKSAGIQSYLIAIYSGDRTYVKKDWASPSQFNHMILGVQISDAVQSPAVVATPAGRLLIFDPTDDKTPMGDLPYYEQGSYALICAGARGDIAQMPVIAPDTNLLARTIHASIDRAGKLTASYKLESQGQAARLEREIHDVSPEQYKAEMERSLDYYAKTAAIGKIEAHDAFEQNLFTANVDFESAGYAQIMQGRLLIFNPIIIPPAARHFPAEQTRNQPIVLNSRLYRQTVTVKLPDGFSVDEMPEPFHAESAFAKFNISYRKEAGQIIVDEELRTEPVTLPADAYPKVKKFFDDVYGANNRNAVLVKN
jgi:transglutaminase-like putative cysteine protease